MLSIKTATINDIPLILELTKKIWPATYILIIGKEQVEYMLSRFYAPEVLEEQMTKGGHHFILCYCGELPVAFAAYSFLQPESVKLHKIYLLPEQQGKGIGKYIIEQIALRISEGGATSLVLNVNRYNTPAIVFYEKNGFRLFREEDIDIGNGYFMNDYVLIRPV